jgi:hypothetical protein
MAEKQAQRYERVENKWFAGVSYDEYIGQDGSFQYSENIDVRNNLKWFGLSAWVNDNPLTRVLLCYAAIDQSTFVRIYKNWGNAELYLSSNTTYTTEVLKATVSDFQINNAVARGKYVFTFWAKVHRADITTGTVIDITAMFANYSGSWDHYALVEGNRYVYVAGNYTWDTGSNSVWFLDTEQIGVPGKLATLYSRYTNGTDVVGMVRVDATIKVYTNYKGLYARAYLGRSGDSRSSNAVQYDGMILVDIIQNSNLDYLIARSSADNTILTMYEASWYDKNVIRSSRYANGNTEYIEDFYWTGGWSQLQGFTHKWVAYMCLDDGIWTYGPNGSLTNPSLSMHWVNKTSHRPVANTRCGDYMYVTFQVGTSTSYIERQYYLAYRPISYAVSGMLISRVFTGERYSKNKNTMEINVGYDMHRAATNPGTILMYIREDKKEENKTWSRTLVSTITDKNKKSERILLSMPAMRVDFNCLEYKIEINRWDANTSPLVTEVQVLYIHNKD